MGPECPFLPSPVGVENATGYLRVSGHLGELGRGPALGCAAFL